jgi:hypothetical protein
VAGLGRSALAVDGLKCKSGHVIMSTKSDAYLKEHNQKLQAAEKMLPLIGALWRDQEVPTYIYGQPLHLKGPTDILRAHRQVRQILGHELSSVDTLKFVEALSSSTARGSSGHRETACPTSFSKFRDEC